MSQGGSADEYRVVPRRARRGTTRELARGTLHIADEVEGEDSARPDSTSDDDEAKDETYKVSPRGHKRSGRFKRGSSSSGGRAASGGNGSGGAGGLQQGDEDAEVNAPGQPQFVPMLRPKEPVVPHDYLKTDYTKRGMTVKARKEREKDPFGRTQGRSVDYRFQTKFQQDFYVCAILSKQHKVARSRFIDWQQFEDMHDPIFDEIIHECKRKHIYRFMGFRNNWNTEVIAQFYATCYWDDAAAEAKDRWVHWRTEGTWYKVSYAEFSTMFGFGKNDYDREYKIHRGGHFPKESMKYMYLPGKEHNFGLVKGMIPFFGYLNKFFRKTLAPREGDSSNISSFLRNLLHAMNPSEPEFSMFDYIWEEIKDISGSPQKSCGFGPYLMFMIEAKTHKKFECDYIHAAIDTGKDLHPGPTLQAIRQLRGEVAAPDDIGAAPGIDAPPQAPSAPPTSTRSRSRLGGTSDSYFEKPPSPMKKLFNLLVGVCKGQRDIMVEQRKQNIKLKKLGNEMRRIDRALNISPPRSPISDSPEAKISPLSAIVHEHCHAPHYDDYGGMFFPNVGASSSAAAPPPPPYHPAPTSYQPTPAYYHHQPYGAPQGVTHPPPYTLAPESYAPGGGFDSFGSWMFDGLGDHGQGTSGQGGGNGDEDAGDGDQQ